MYLTEAPLNAVRRTVLRYTIPLILVAAFLSTAVVSNTAVARSLPDFTNLVERNGPAVVNISTTQKKKSRRSVLPHGLEIPDLPKGSPFNEFFRRFFGEGEIEEFDAQSLGSGFIISEDGYVISNNHVVREADEIIVRLTDRREFKAVVVGTDERSDIALLKIEAADLPVVKLGRGYDLKVGEWVLAIGSPFGFDYSVTAGIVSAKGRSLPRESYVPFIQTDVAINPGNSGGPLFNLDGEVVGVNSQIFSRTGGFMGLSFAIPIDVAMEVVDQIRNFGRVSRGWLGVLIQDVTRELAESFGMDHPRGALVARVLEDSPAAKGGLQIGDIVLTFNGTRITRSSDLPPIVGRTSVGKSSKVVILREGEKKTLSITIAELPEEEKLARATGSAPVPQKAGAKFGMTLADPTPAQVTELEMPDHGVVVAEVWDGAARKAGIRVNDIILMVNSERIADAATFEAIVNGLPAGKTVSVLVQRRGNPLFLAMRIPK